VSPRRVDPFKVDPQASFSKGQVDRAARLILEFWSSDPEVSPIDDWDVNALVDAMYAVTWWRSLHAVPLTKVAANLRYHVAKEGGHINERVEVTQRLKRRNTMIFKLAREPKMNLTRMGDIGGVRALLPSIDHIYAVSRRLRKTWTIARTLDYIADPKPSGYRAIHHVVRRDGRLVEVQLRTSRQDAWANQVEEDGRFKGVDLKSGFGAAEIHAYYVVVAEAFAVMDRGVPPFGWTVGVSC
jgi:ppGpp synthetase/RelA/SpoT-type nucleotidyltranferase